MLRAAFGCIVCHSERSEDELLRTLSEKSESIHLSSADNADYADHIFLCKKIKSASSVSSADEELSLKLYVLSLLFRFLFLLFLIRLR